MKYISIVFFSLAINFQATAQQLQFIRSGTVTYERTINLYSLYNDQPEMVEILRKNGVNFKREMFTLDFDEKATLYQAGEQLIENSKFERIPFDHNSVFTNLKEHSRLSRKNIYDDTYLIADSIRNGKWKLTSETRNIAGFECRRANAIMFDSIYVIAFFTEEITPSGGPESFNGLPGMILGIAIPQQHITYFATKLSVQPKSPVISDVQSGKGIIKVAYKGLIQELFNLSGQHQKLWYYKFGFF